MGILNNKPLLFGIGAVLFLAFPAGFFVYVLVIGTMFLMRSMDARLSGKTNEEVSEEMSPTQQTFFYLMKHTTTPKVAHNGEHSKLSEYEKETWNDIVTQLREEDSK